LDIRQHFGGQIYGRICHALRWQCQDSLKSLRILARKRLQSLFNRAVKWRGAGCPFGFALGLGYATLYASGNTAAKTYLSSSTLTMSDLLQDIFLFVDSSGPNLPYDAILEENVK
jgi:hypothetical protein